MAELYWTTAELYRATAEHYCARAEHRSTRADHWCTRAENIRPIPRLLVALPTDRNQPRALNPRCGKWGKKKTALAHYCNIDARPKPNHARAKPWACDTS